MIVSLSDRSNVVRRLADHQETYARMPLGEFEIKSQAPNILVKQTPKTACWNQGLENILHEPLRALHQFFDLLLGGLCVLLVGTDVS